MKMGEEVNKITYKKSAMNFGADGTIRLRC